VIILNQDFTDKTVMVTGAGHGLGRAIATAFDAAGARVSAVDINQAALKESAQLLSAASRTAVVDVTGREALRHLVEEAGGQVDILVNCAGGVAGQTGRPLEEVSPQDWQVLFDINVSGAFNCAQAVAPGMKQAGGGRIINISSRAGLRTSLTGIQAYAAAKAALIGLTRQLAQELGPWDITVNSVAPGFVRCNPTTEAQWQSYSAEEQQRLVDGIALRRLGKPEDIAGTVLFFASGQADWITGQTLSVDGG
jgi:3-oxoacyl-[acyl-carrier protein] reductase